MTSNPTTSTACEVSWCTARHSDLRDASSRTHTAELATCAVAGERLTARLTWIESLNGAVTSEPPSLLLVTTQQTTGGEPLPPAVIRLDARRAADLARVLRAATGLHWLIECLDRGVKLMADGSDR